MTYPTLGAAARLRTSWLCDWPASDPAVQAGSEPRRVQQKDSWRAAIRISRALVWVRRWHHWRTTLKMVSEWPVTIGEL
eukprot:scaffold407_cov251-Pinguiococcus_pyrenoidosus.AAC.21